MKICPLEQILARFPDFKPGWASTPEGISNPKYGAVERIVVCKDDGTPHYDQYQLIEKPGAIAVPFFQSTGELSIGMIKLIRPIMRDPATGQQGSVQSYELPRGFSLDGEVMGETVKRELGEETSAVVKDLRCIGRVNPNTAFYPQSIPIYAAEIDPDSVSRFKPDATERILQSTFYSPKTLGSMVMQNQVICGLSKAALMHFFAYVLGFSKTEGRAIAPLRTA